MSELTGPVLGITLVLTSVFLPASFLPGITGQMFRQFALVIASTAIISALNALTLKPTQCALYLRPIPKDKQINWFYRGFNSVYGAIEDHLYRSGQPAWRIIRAHGVRVLCDCRDRGAGSSDIIRRPFCPSRIRATAWSSARLPTGRVAAARAGSRGQHRARSSSRPRGSRDG